MRLSPASPVLDGPRLAVGTLTVVPVRVGAVDRRAAGVAMACAPAVGLGLGAAAGALGWAARWWTGSPLVAGIAAVAVLALLTRALHLDGLADTADGLGSGKPADEALAVMKRSDIGPFGVVALLAVAAFQAGCLAVAFGHGGGTGLATAVTAAAAGRLAITAACRSGVPPARPDGLGAWVAGTVPGWAAVTVAVAVAAAGYGLRGWYGLAAVPVALAVAELTLRHIRRRLGGVTGDVLGALTEIATTAALLVLAR